MELRTDFGAINPVFMGFTTGEKFIALESWEQNLSRNFGFMLDCIFDLTLD